MKIVSCICANESGFVVNKPYEAIPDEVVDDVMQFVKGELEDELVISLFQKLIDLKIVSKLPGSYIHIAAQLIDAGLCNPQMKDAA